MLEYKILNHVIDYMDSTGSTSRLVTLPIDQKLVEEISSDNKSNYSLEELEKATDKCLAVISKGNCRSNYRATLS